MELLDDFSALSPEDRYAWRMDLYRLAEGAFREEYRSLAILPEKYAAPLLDY